MLNCIDPIYGNGWTDGIDTIDEPSPFKIETSDKENGAITGIIVTEGHALAGCNFSARRRFSSEELIFNCAIWPFKGKVLNGYCNILS